MHLETSTRGGLDQYEKAEMDVIKHLAEHPLDNDAPSALVVTADI